MMAKKTLTVLSISLFLMTSCFIYAQDSSKLIGNWKGQSGKGEVIKIEFHKDGTTELYSGFGGRYNGKVTAAIFWPTYNVDFSKSPYRLNFIYSSKGGKNSQKIKCIFKFINENEIEIGLPGKDDYPKDFDVLNVYEIWKLKRTSN